MIIKTSELAGVTLDWSVAKCEEEYNGTPEIIHNEDGILLGFVVPDGYIEGLGEIIKVEKYSPSTDWAQGGPIIELEKIGHGWTSHTKDFIASLYGKDIVMHGPTPLIAAMRCFVANKLGNKVEIPEEIYHADNH